MSASVSVRGPFWMFFGATFTVFGGFGLLMLAALSDELGHAGTITNTSVLLWLVLGVATWLPYLLRLPPPRWVLGATVLKGVTFLPMLFFFAAGSLSYPLFAPMPTWSRTLLWAFALGGTAVWAWIDVRDRRRRMVAKQYLAREFHDMGTHIEVAWSPKTDLSPPPISDKTTLGRLYNAHGYKVIAWLLPMGFPIQKLLSGAGGVEAVSAVLFLLGAPLLMWGLKSLFCGAYIWLYCVWKIERETGKKVLYTDDL